ncbi:related to metalloprotease [Serendipita indica DSM 11827]|uniref:Related to metalloprotease n=1 Tax=Serendipita indica (strain DSM 11827) TaxID=1109443 RepID=G4TN22_SERID|nr:related to metalloprotease [Serendipita indica DSM 11827]
MLFEALIVYASLTMAFAAPFYNYTRCANHYNSTQLQAMEARYTQDLSAAEASGSFQRLAPPSTASARSSLGAIRCRTVHVVWHIIYESETVEGGYMSDKAVQDSIDALNEHYGETDFWFVLDRTTRTKNKTWFNKVNVRSPLQDDMKKQLHVGDARTLNVYTVNFPTAGFLGYAPYPQFYAQAPWDDGVVIKHSSVPGGAAVSFNQGKTLTHEVGHWLGLLHVFNEDGKCVDWDFVSDTPVQSTWTEGCPTSKDSCDGLPGEDSIHNFMDYSTDACLTEFTPGQIARMYTQSNLYRKFSWELCRPFDWPILTRVPTITRPIVTAIATAVIPVIPVIPGHGLGPAPVE